MIKISPSLLSADWTKINKELDDIITGGATWVHFDVMDGKFVPATTFTPAQLKQVTDLSGQVADVHIMVEDPIGQATEYAKMGADYITFHVEATNDPLKVINHIKSLGVKAGISLKPGTPLSAIEPYLSEVELVLVMTVEPGKGGQSFMFDQVEKIEKLSKMKNKYNYQIEVDGGINAETAKIVIDAGADILVSGSYIFKATDRKQAIDSLKHEKQ